MPRPLKKIYLFIWVYMSLWCLILGSLGPVICSSHLLSHNPLHHWIKEANRSVVSHHGWISPSFGSSTLPSFNPHSAPYVNPRAPFLGTSHASAGQCSRGGKEGEDWFGGGTPDPDPFGLLVDPRGNGTSSLSPPRVPGSRPDHSGFYPSYLRMRSEHHVTAESLYPEFKAATTTTMTSSQLIRTRSKSTSSTSGGELPSNSYDVIFYSSHVLKISSSSIC